MTVNVGDRVQAWKYVMGREYSITGTVKSISAYAGDQVALIVDDDGDSDYYNVASDLENRMTVIEQATPLNPATSRQIAYLRDLGVADVPANLSKSQASRMIDEAKSAQQPSCHYCGMPATSAGFFDEPICSECGG